MFDKIQHIGYLVADMDQAVAWFEQGFGAANAGGLRWAQSLRTRDDGRIRPRVPLHRQALVARRSCVVAPPARVGTRERCGHRRGACYGLL